MKPWWFELSELNEAHLVSEFCGSAVRQNCCDKNKGWPTYEQSWADSIGLGINGSGRGDGRN